MMVAQPAEAAQESLAENAPRCGEFLVVWKTLSVCWTTALTCAYAKLGKINYSQFNSTGNFTALTSKAS